MFRHSCSRLILGALFATTLHAAHAEHGGISGGGGGTTNPNPAHQDDISKAISQAKPMIVAWLNQQRAAGNLSSLDALGDKLFRSSPNVFDVLNRTQLTVRLASSCLDPQGQNVDGSAAYVGDVPTICISQSNLVAKLSEYNFEYETIALVLHELTHLLGATEAEAVAAQRAIIPALIPYSYEAYGEHIRRALFYSKWVLDHDLEYLKYVVYSPYCHRIVQIVTNFHDFTWNLATLDGHLSPLNEVDHTQIDQIAKTIGGFYGDNCPNDLETIPLETVKRNRPKFEETARVLRGLHERIDRFMRQRFETKTEI